jgi:hypothetical protein
MYNSNLGSLHLGNNLQIAIVMQLGIGWLMFQFNELDSINSVETLAV